MLFNSLAYAVFLPLVFLIYWLVFPRRLKWQNLWLVAASYYFYACWDWRFLSLIILSSLIDYGAGLALGKFTRDLHRKLFLWLSIVTNIGILGFFKYYNFFIDSLLHASPGLRYVVGDARLDIILPVGISFYTFQTLSYTIDVYRRKLAPTKDLIAFLAFVSFFPQLVAGPIERATNLLPQICNPRTFDYRKAVDGMRQILWGFFKKILIADSCAIYVNEIYANWTDYSGSTLWLGTFLFAVQIYCDFSGYSDIAIGSARLFGIDLMRNFEYPYFSRDIAEFWRRWHISLSTWFRDYVYVPLGGSRVASGRKVANVFAVFLLSGLWHGANWTFVVWGFLNAVYFLPLLLLEKNHQHTDIPAEGRILPRGKEVLQIGATFLLTNIAWVFFRAESVGQALGSLSRMLSRSALSVPEVLPAALILGIGLFFLVEWLQRDKQHALEIREFLPSRPLRWAVYSVVILILGIAMPTSETPFIYFQF
ncbi:MAG TPA: MBOAT family O-acyltransferase [Acidobacteriota bacterium]|nr:MBOAT family O-acyltransferase [Acidobacteriota bacterium]